ncbi:TorF family putative porin [Paraferrimonas sp. SM1919]|uniref:TorF family putative porin n=1 Tax=Paraferrimonas sp. SM1919 TaxID=2662263 RepID=UPI0013CF84CB|nr:TorF family putative porin [Paraferrimonas sp. SM1919]
MQFKRQLIAASVLAGLSFSASAELSGYVTLNSDYMFRAVSLNDKKPALQAGIDWEAESGWYTGAWASQTDDGETKDVEIDIWGGYYGETESGFFYDANLIYYALVDASDYNYGELHGNIGQYLTDELTIGLNVDYAVLAASGFDNLKGLHISGYAEYALTEDMAISVEYGQQKWEDWGENGDYNWARASFTKDYENFGFELSAWTNDIEGDESSRFSASVSYNF